MAIFTENKELELLEEQGLFMQAVEYTNSIWQINKDNIQNLLRAGTEAWFANVFDCMAKETIDYNRCDAILTETYQYGETHFSNQADFLCIFGYILKLSPYYLNTYDSNYERWKWKGNAMIEKAHQLKPMDKFIQAVYSLDSQTRTFLQNNYFEGNSEVETYFKHILCKM